MAYIGGGEFQFLEPQRILILLMVKNKFQRKPNLQYQFFNSYIIFIEQIDVCVQQLMEEAVILISLYNCILYINIIMFQDYYSLFWNIPDPGLFWNIAGSG